MNEEKFIQTLISKFKEKPQNFGRGEFYQAYEPLGIKGQRPTVARFNTYKLKDILSKEQNVLDIGSNVGFFDSYIYNFVNSIDGIEFNDHLVNIANYFKNHMRQDKLNFIIEKFENFKTNKKYDVVLSLAVHWHLKISFNDFINKIDNMLNLNGYLVIESHNPHKEDSDWKEKIDYIKSKNYKDIYNGNIKDDNKIYRLFNILQKI